MHIGSSTVLETWLVNNSFFTDLKDIEVGLFHNKRAAHEAADEAMKALPPDVRKHYIATSFEREVL